MTPFERLQWIDDIRLGTGVTDFDGMQTLAAAKLTAEGASPRIADYFNRKLESVSTRIHARLTKIVNKEVKHPSQYFDDEDLDALFGNGAERAFDRADACKFTNQVKTAYFTFVNRFVSHNKRESLNNTSSFGNTMKKVLNRVNNKIRLKMNC